MTARRDPYRDSPPNDPARVVVLDPETERAVVAAVKPLDPVEAPRQPTLAIPRHCLAICAEPECGSGFYVVGQSRCPSCGSSEWVMFEKIDRPRDAAREE